MSGLWTVCVEQLFRLLICCTKKKNLCCEGEWKVCVCLLNKTSTVEQHIFSIEANWFLQNYSLFLPVCHKKTGFAYFPFSTAEAKVFLHWPVYNSSVVMRLDLKKKKTTLFLVLYLFGFYLFEFFLSVQVKHYSSVGINVQIQQNDCAISWVSERNPYCSCVRFPFSIHKKATTLKLCIWFSVQKPKQDRINPFVFLLGKCKS